MQINNILTWILTNVGATRVTLSDISVCSELCTFIKLNKTAAPGTTYLVLTSNGYLSRQDELF